MLSLLEVSGSYWLPLTEIVTFENGQIISMYRISFHLAQQLNKCEAHELDLFSF